MATNVEPTVAAGDRPLPDDRLRDILYLLKLARYFDERMEALYRQGRLPGAIYSGRGQEGTHVGVVSALEADDSLFPTHRDLTAQLAKGLDLKRVMAQFWGRIDGYTRGRDGNSHIGDWDGQQDVHRDVPPPDRLPGGDRRGVGLPAAGRSAGGAWRSAATARRPTAGGTSR